jgi:16S rRNA (uracil1498-N3)-methyltransferase
VTAPHFFVAPDQPIQPGAEVVLDPEDSRHALRSRRLRPGEEVTVADGSGVWASGAMAGERDGRAVIEIREARHVGWPEPSLTVAMAPPKGDRLAWAVQKLAEVGVDRLEIVETDRTVRDWSPERADRAVQRLRSVAREAAMQARRPFVMEIERPGPAAPRAEATTILLWEEARERLSDALAAPLTPIRLLVGPEGGFTHEEVADAVGRGAVAASLGPAILRTETAAVVGATLVLARFGRLG